MMTPDFIKRVYGIDLDVVEVEGKPFVLAV